jgi:hypothetical protein
MTAQPIRWVPVPRPGSAARIGWEFGSIQIRECLTIRVAGRRVDADGGGLSQDVGVRQVGHERAGISLAAQGSAWCQLRTCLMHYIDGPLLISVQNLDRDGTIGFGKRGL